MRVSVKVDHPDFREGCGDYEVTLDGEKTVACVFADNVKGEVHCFMLDNNGEIMADENSGHPKEIISYGKVVIYDGNGLQLGG